MKRTISVEPEDIAKGERHAACYCPIAHASKRALSWQRVYVMLGSKCISPLPSGTLPEAIALPAEAVKWAHNFDQTGKGVPFTFEVDDHSEAS